LPYCLNHSSHSRVLHAQLLGRTYFVVKCVLEVMKQTIQSLFHKALIKQGIHKQNIKRVGGDTNIDLLPCIVSLLF